MPEMNGSELVEKLHSQKPDLKVLLISGYQDHEENAAASIQLIQKPFSGALLLERVREVFECKKGLPC